MRRSSAKTRRLITASASSLALHALVLVIVARISWEPDEREQRPSTEIVWLAEVTIPAANAPEPVDPEPVPERESEPPEAPEPEPPEPEPEPPEPDIEQVPQPDPEPSQPAPSAEPSEVPQDAPPPAPPVEPEPTLEPDSTTVPAPIDPSSDAPAERAADAPRNFVVTEAELEEAWRRALEEVRAQRELEENYLTFSLDDLVDEPADEETEPTESIFEAAERYAGSGGPSVLSPDRARTRVGRALAEFCNALTGGFGVGLNGIGLFSVCAERGESAKLFARIKPAYLRSRPVCTEIETGTMAAEGDAPTIKCELVEMDALAEQEEYELQ